MKTSFINKTTLQRKWHLVDAKDQILGRLATQVSRILSGKGKRTYTPFVDGGDYVVVINAQDVKIKGNSKPDQKIDFRHSGYPGGYTMTPYRTFMKEKPDRAVELSVSGMLPKNKLRSRMMARLKVYKGSTHPHGSNLSQPKPAAETAQA